MNPDAEIDCADLRPGMFFYDQGSWYLALSGAFRRKSSWWLVDVLNAEGARNQRFRLVAERVRVSYTAPKNFLAEEITSRIERRRTRIRLWEKEIAMLERLRELVRGHAVTWKDEGN